MLSWIILIGGSLLGLAIACTMIQNAVENRRAGKADRVRQAVVLSALIVIVLGVVQYTVVWPWAMRDHIADKEQVVKDFFKERTSRVPDAVKLRPTDATQKGQTDAYIGTAQFGTDEVWDVRVWHEYKAIKMEATPRVKQESGQ